MRKLKESESSKEKGNVKADVTQTWKLSNVMQLFFVFYIYFGHMKIEKVQEQPQNQQTIVINVLIWLTQCCTHVISS